MGFPDDGVREPRCNRDANVGSRTSGTVPARRDEEAVGLCGNDLQSVIRAASRNPIRILSAGMSYPVCPVAASLGSFCEFFFRVCHADGTHFSARLLHGSHGAMKPSRRAGTMLRHEGNAAGSRRLAAYHPLYIGSDRKMRATGTSEDRRLAIAIWRSGDGAVVDEDRVDYSR